MGLHENIRPARELLDEAVSKKFAVGAFNFSNMETIQAIVESANELGTPVILQVTESAIRYIGLDYVLNMVVAAARSSSVKLALHLDHGKDADICRSCIDAGFTSVMIDRSSYPFEENISVTREVVSYAKERGVSVEAELGSLSGVEDDVSVLENDSFFTDPDQAAEFIERTNINSLAVAIGTSHGPHKGKSGSPKLDIQRLSQIRERVGKFPLVLHGASSVYQDVVSMCNEYGSDIQNTFGITDSDISDAIKMGVAKINVDTDMRLAFLAGLLKSLRQDRSNIDIRKYLGEAKTLAKDVIMRKMKTFSACQA
jgi:fructose-bisphosphate aldolase class II